jgi:prepilin peptidase CpaA
MILLLVAAVQDFMQLKISNVIVVLVLSCAFLAVAVGEADTRLWHNLAVAAAIFAAGAVLFARGKVGGGDVKLFAALGLWFDWAAGFQYIVAVLLAGGVLAIITLSVRQFDWSPKTRERVVTLRPRGGVPYAVAIAAGGMLMVSMQLF